VAVNDVQRLREMVCVPAHLDGEAIQGPSALFPTEAHNYVLSPAHPEFDAAVEVDDSAPLRLDPRIEARVAKDSS